MDINAFWELIEGARAQGEHPGTRLDWLNAELARRPVADIVDFQLRLDEAKRPADTWTMWGAAYLILDGLCSGDGFWYFQPWLVGLGREACERVIADPDALIDVPGIQRLAWRGTRDWADAEWPEWESLNYLARNVYDLVTGEDDGLFEAMEARGHHSGHDPDPSGDRWDFDDPAEARRRLPRLSQVFPLTGRGERDRRGRVAFERLLAERGQTEEEFCREFGLVSRPAR
jgi:hypothetical protein